MHWIKRPLTIGLISGLIILTLVTGYFLLKQPDRERPVDAVREIGAGEWHIGDPVPVTLRVTAEHGYQVEIPELKVTGSEENTESPELVKTKSIRKKSLWAERYEDRYLFTAMTPGEYQFPAMTISYTTPAGEHKNIQLPAAALSVKSMLTDDAKELRGLKPLAKAPVNSLLYYGFALLALLGLLAYFVIRRLRKPAKETDPEAEPPLPAHALAYRRLNELLVSDWIETGQVERYFTVLSEIVREYIEQRFGAKAREMTTQEFLTAALRKLGLSHDQQDLLRRFMELSDLVKYARHVPAYEQIRQAFDAARQFVDETKEEIAENVGEEEVGHAESHL